MANEIGLIKSFTINITIALLLFLIGIIAILIFIFIPQWKEELIFGGSVIVAISALYSGYYIAYGLKENIRRDSINRAEDIRRDSINRAEDIRRDSINRALEFAERFDDLRTLKLRNFVAFEKQCLAPVDVVKKIEVDEELLISLRKILALFEDSSIAIQMGIVDEKTLYLSIITLVIKFFECFEEYIENVREEMKDKTVYIEFEKLYRSWKINKSILTAEKIE